MKLLTLILYLATGDQSRVTMPAWECHAATAEMEHAWMIGGHVDQDDGVRVVAVKCVAPTWHDTLTLSSNGNCDMEDEA